MRASSWCLPLLLTLQSSLAAQRVVLHIVADDVGFNDLGFVNDAIHTPHIDVVGGG